MKSDEIHILRNNFRALSASIEEVKSLLSNRRLAREVKYDPNQPRAPEGTTSGGQWVGSGRSGGQSSRPRAPAPRPPPRTAIRAPQTLSGQMRPSLRTPLPVIAGSIAIQRAAGTFASEVSGQAKTPFLHIPYTLPTIGTAQSRPRTSLGRGQVRTRQAVQSRKQRNVDRQCDAQFEFDTGMCGTNSRRYGQTDEDRRAIYAICRQTAMVRYSECTTGGGIHAIRTPLYRGHNYRRKRP
jgi:hypothetical protein